jgi:hypothetical protein
MVELPEELPLVGTLHEELLQQKWPMKNGDFSKTVKPAIEEAAALAKARIPKLQENLLKRTAKRDPSRCSACKTEISC